MKDYYGKTKEVFYDVMTGKQFVEKYKELSESENMLPTASQIVPIKDNDNNENSALFHCFIYYDVAPEKVTTVQNQPQKNKEKIKMEL